MHFLGEDGQDGGGLRKELISLAIDYSFSILLTQQDEIELDPAEVDDLYFVVGTFIGELPVEL